MSCRAALIHICHAVPLPFSDSAVSFVKVRVVAGNIRTASPTLIGMLLITFVERRVVAGRSRTREGRPHTVSGLPTLIHTCHVIPIPRWAVALRSHFQNGMVVALHGRGMDAAWARHDCGMACVNQTRPHCVHQMGKIQCNPLAARHGRETAWARQGNGMICVN
jgi:hypothetical protein